MARVNKTVALMQTSVDPVTYEIVDKKDIKDENPNILLEIEYEYEAGDIGIVAPISSLRKSEIIQDLNALLNAAFKSASIDVVTSTIQEIESYWANDVNNEAKTQLFLMALELKRQIFAYDIKHISTLKSLAAEDMRRLSEIQSELEHVLEFPHVSIPHTLANKCSAMMDQVGELLKTAEPEISSDEMKQLEEDEQKAKKLIKPAEPELPDYEIKESEEIDKPISKNTGKVALLAIPQGADKPPIYNFIAMHVAEDIISGKSKFSNPDAKIVLKASYAPKSGTDQTIQEFNALLNAAFNTKNIDIEKSTLEEIGSLLENSAKGEVEMQLVLMAFDIKAKILEKKIEKYSEKIHGDYAETHVLASWQYRNWLTPVQAEIEYALNFKDVAIPLDLAKKYSSMMEQAQELLKEAEPEISKVEELPDHELKKLEKIEKPVSKAIRRKVALLYTFDTPEASIYSSPTIDLKETVINRKEALLTTSYIPKSDTDSQCLVERGFPCD